jgi:hypothetical protein
MTNHIPNDLSHLSDAEFNLLCPQGEHAPGPQPLSPAAQAVLCAYRDLSWTPDEEDNGKYYKFSHKAGMAAALRAAANQVVPKTRAVDSDLDYGAWEQQQRTRAEILAIADELEGHA